MSSDGLGWQPLSSDRLGWWRWKNNWNRSSRGLDEDGFCCGFLKYFFNFNVSIGYIIFIL